MFTELEEERFATYGLVKRSNFLPAQKLSDARRVIVRQLEKVGVWQNGRWSYDSQPWTTRPDAGMKLLKPIKRHKSLLALATGEAEDAASALVDGRPVVPLSPYPSLLFTLPNATSWTVPYKAWHLDMPRLPDGGVPGIQIFVFLDTVEPGGGGTLVVTGSHHLLNEGIRIRSSDLRKRLKQAPYFADLMSSKSTDRLRFVNEVGYVDDIELQVVEMTGQAGDAYFMDLRMLHTIAPNSLNVPRIMLTQRYLLESSYIALYGQLSEPVVSDNKQLN